MIDLESARNRWLAEREAYAAFSDAITERLRDAVRSEGIPCDLFARAKELHSLIKKLIKKPSHSYETVSDKAGVRCIVRYLSDLEAVVSLAGQIFKCGPVDRKAEGLGPDRLGYLSIHINVRLRDDDPNVVRFGGYQAELQVRTLGQHLWAEMSHDAVYKNEEWIASVAEPAKRRVNLMAGLIEIADQEFDRLNRELQLDEAADLYRTLERYYFSLTSRPPDRELSLYIIRLIRPLYDGLSTSQIVQRVDEFVRARRADLRALLDPAPTDDASVLLSQPEILMVLERLSDNQDAIRELWTTALPEKELETIANIFGISFD
jgi:ppGpp synthetase/RelA/SpoT-type nucleotidyltranferase